MACTPILVGKHASYDGSTIVARNEDSPNGKFEPQKMMAVSYTHLDVYKRQRWGSTPPCRSSRPLLARAPPIRRRSPIWFARCSISITTQSPVSYTHLLQGRVGLAHPQARGQEEDQDAHRPGLQVV